MIADESPRNGWGSQASEPKEMRGVILKHFEQTLGLRPQPDGTTVAILI